MQVRIVAPSAALIWCSIATSVAAAPLQPIEKWDLDYGDTQCTAARTFGSESDPVILGIVPSLSGGTYKLLISIARSGPTFAKESRGTVDFGRGGMSSDMLYYGGKGVKLSIYQFRISAADMEQARSAPTVSLRSESGDHYAFALAAMPALLDALHKCTADLQQYWNMDGKKSVSTAQSTIGDVRALFTRKDYPAEAFRNQQQGKARYQLLIDEKGTVAGCDVLVPSGVAALDATGCEVIKERARFSPAKDSQGKAVRSVVTTAPIEWKLSELLIFNNGCRMVAANSATILSQCGRGARSLAPMPIPVRVARPAAPSTRAPKG